MMKPLKRPMPWEPFIEANLGPVLPSRPYVVRNSISAPHPYGIGAVQHRSLQGAVTDLLDCRERWVEFQVKRHRQQREYLHRLHKWERGETTDRPPRQSIL